MASTKYTRKTMTAKKVEEVEEPEKSSTEKTSPPKEKTSPPKEKTSPPKEKTSPPKEKKEEIVYGEPVPTTELLELEILRSTTCDSEVA